MIGLTETERQVLTVLKRQMHRYTRASSRTFVNLGGYKLVKHVLKQLRRRRPVNAIGEGDQAGYVINDEGERALDGG